MQFLDRFLRSTQSRPLDQLSINQEVTKINKNVSKNEKEGERSIRIFTLQTLNDSRFLIESSRFEVFDEHRRISFHTHFFLDQNGKMMIDVKKINDSLLEVLLCKSLTGVCTFTDRQGRLSVTLSHLGKSMIDCWTLEIREHKYTMTASNAGSTIILRGFNNSPISRIRFHSTTRLTWFSSNLISDLHITALLSILMWYYEENPDFGLERFVRLENANRPVQQTQGNSSLSQAPSSSIGTSPHRTLRRQTGSISNAHRDNSNTLPPLSNSFGSVDRRDRKISSRKRVLPSEPPIVEESENTDRENCHAGPSNHKQSH
ncbi:hypothetical protein DFH28DRAFT_1129887 [Melampsora americana]|nr:hypothetical protein DFH28DRAFT_1129887 [Melampsora americana]